MSDIEFKKLSLEWNKKFLKRQATLYEALGVFLHLPYPLPSWIVEAVESGFEDRISGRRDLDQVFGLTPKPGKQIDKTARRLTFAPAVYWEVTRLNENGSPIDNALFEKVADIFSAPITKQFPKSKAPGARTIKEWYLEELRAREPELATKRNKSKSL